MRVWSSSRPVRALVAVCAGALVTSACQSGAADPAVEESTNPSVSASSVPSTPTRSEQEIRLDFGVFGNDEEFEAWETAVDSYNEVFDADVRLIRSRTWQRANASMQAGNVPDVFMINRRDLATYRDQGLTQPVDELLDERGLNFGDDYFRAAMEEFSVDTSLACMPLSISPMVMYLNRDLVDFDTMAERGLEVPPTMERWNFDQFAAAADFAARPQRAISGVYIDPTLLGLAPFVRSGGGALFDDPETPTTLTLSSEESNAALERTLAVLRNPQISPSPIELASTPAVEMFMNGDLGMIAGSRNLTERLRQQDELNFDVLPMPVLDSGSTVADLEGVCLSADTEDTAAAADFLAFALQESTLRALARANRTVPASAVVANSSDFLQPWDQPRNSTVFVGAMRNVEAMPLLRNGAALDEAVEPLLYDLLTEPVLDLPVVTSEIDAVSQTVLTPETATESPSAQ